MGCNLIQVSLQYVTALSYHVIHDVTYVSPTGLGPLLCTHQPHTYLTIQPVSGSDDEKLKVPEHAGISTISAY